MATKTATLELQFGELPEPQGFGGGRSSWMEDPAQVAPVDAFIEAASEKLAEAPDDVKGISAKGFLLPAEDEKKQLSKTVQRINQRCEFKELQVHATSRNGILCFMRGTKPVRKRTRKQNGENS